ncbi:MAG: right-handed parallel beta-helix repeat-containing protein [Xanthomonadales bacterium]|nr:right-handed parallel beta-helix repeat-containing protein [Xanthomonadales bacterium]
MLRLQGEQTVPTIVFNNKFKGFTNQYRGLWIQDRRGITVDGNTFTPESSASDYTAITVGNRQVQSGAPGVPQKFGDLTIVGNTFEGGAAGGKGKAIYFVNDNDNGGGAKGDSPFVAHIGGAAAGAANKFDNDIRWFVALDDRTCNALNHNSETTSGCRGASNTPHPLGEAISYSGGANSASQKAPFRWDVSVGNNLFDVVPLAAMSEAQYEAVRAKTYAGHTQGNFAPGVLGNVLYDWTPPPPPPNVALTITQDPTNDHKVGSVQNLGLAAVNNGGAGLVRGRITITRNDGQPIPLAEDGSDEIGDALAVATDFGPAPLTRAADGLSVSLVWPPFDVPLEEGAQLDPQAVYVLFRVPGTYHALAEIYDVANDATIYGSSTFDLAITQDLAVAFTGANPTPWTGSAQPLAFSVSPTSNPALADLSAKVSLTYNGGTDAPVAGGNYAVVAISHDADYLIEPAASTSYVIQRATGTVAWGALEFAYNGHAHALSAKIAETSEPCVVSPASIGPDVGQWTVTATCSGAAMDASASATASIGGSDAVHVRETGFLYDSVADALADDATHGGMTVELRPGTYAGPITLTKGVRLVGGIGIQDGSGGMTLSAGPTQPPTTEIVGGGIVIAAGVTNASVSGFTVRDVAGDCISAIMGNHGLVVDENIIHDCSGHGINVNGGAGIDSVTIRNNEVYAAGNRGIVVWNGLKRDIAIVDNYVHDITGLSGIELQDGAAAGAVITGNIVERTADTGIGAVQLTSGSLTSRANRIADNIVSDTGRFGINLVIPNGTGAETGDGAILVENNTITAGATAADLRDRAGITVIRRAWSPSVPIEVDATIGVVVRYNAVTGYRTAAGGGYEGYGVVVEGLGSSVYGNILTNNDIGLQIQQGNPNGTPPGDADQNVHSDWFGRGNAALSCVGLGNNIFTDNDLETRFQQPAGSSDTMLGGVHNENSGSWHCTIGAAITAASAGDSLRVVTGTYAENVVIGKSLTLKGPYAGTAGDDASRTGLGEAVISPASGVALSITAADVVVDGFELGHVTSNRVVHVGTVGGNKTGLRFVNNRIVEFTSSHSTGGAIFIAGSVGVPAATGMEISGNLLQNLSNGASGTFAMGIKVADVTDLQVTNNVFRHVQSNAMQLTRVAGAEVLGNDVDGEAADYTNVGIQVTYGSNISIRDNSFDQTLQALLFNANSGPGVTFACNAITDSRYGIRGASFGTSGAAVYPHVFDNAVQATTALRNDDLPGAVVMGSNWYGGSAPTRSGALQVADALAANPIGNPACGANTPATLVTYAGTGTQSAPVDTAFDDLRVRVQDALGGAVMGAPISLMTPTSGATTTLGANAGSTNYNGEFVTMATANSIAGSYQVTASSGSLADASFNLTNTMGTATVTVTGGSFVFDGQPHPVVVVTDPAGLESDVQVVYTDAASATITCVATDAACGPVAPGSYDAVATISGNPNYSGSGNGSVTIADTSDISLAVSGPARVEAGELDDGYVATLANDGGMSPQKVFLRLTLTRSSGEAVAPADIEVCIPDPSQTIAYGVCDVGEVWLGNKTQVTPTSVQVRYPQLSQNEIEVPANLPATPVPARMQLAAGNWHLLAEVVSSDGITVYASDSHDVQSRIATTISLADLVQAYDGTPKSASITTDPAGVNVDVTYDGTGAPTTVGSYALVAKVNQLYHDGAEATGTFQITKSTASVTLSHLVQAYDGSPKSVVVTTVPAGLPVSVTYDGSTTPPTAKDTYAVNATVTDSNYTGSANGTLQIVTGSGDMALVLNGPVDAVHVGDKAQYAATMLANPALHVGEMFGYRVELTKSGGLPLDLADIATMEVFYGNDWVDATEAFGSIPFVLDPLTNTLTYNFPEGIPGYASGFPIEDPSWTWNFRFSFATEGTYTTTATLVEGIGGADVSPSVQASIATVVETALPPTDIHLVLGGPIETEVGQWTEYSGTLLAEPALHTGEKFFVKVRLSRAGGVMTAADFDAMQIRLGTQWVDGADLGVAFTTDGNDLIYLFPESQMPGGFPIEDPSWTWNFRFQYASADVYTATAQVIPAWQADLGNPDVLASGAVATTVRPATVLPPVAHLVLLGPVQAVEAHTPVGYTGTLVADAAGFAGRSFWMRVRLSKAGGTMLPTDLEKMELFNGIWIDATTQIQGAMQQDGNDVLYYFPQPVGGAFPIEDDVWSWHFRFTYAGAGEYHASADLIDASDLPPATAASLAHAEVGTTVKPQSADISLQLQGAVVGTVGQPAQYIGTLRADPLPDPASLYFVEVRLHKSTGAMAAADLSRMEILWGGQWVDPAQPPYNLALPFTVDNGDLVYLFPKPIMDSGFPIDEAEWSWQFRFTYADAAIYTATARVLDAGTMEQVSAPVTIHTDVTPAPADISLQLNGPVAGVEVGVPAAYIGRLQNHGADMPEDAYVKVRVDLAGGTLAVGDVIAYVWDGSDWVPGSFAAVSGGLEVAFPDSAGFPIPAGFDWTHHFRITYARPGIYMASASLVGVMSGDPYATAAMFTEVDPASAAVSLQLNGPVAGVEMGVPAAYIGRLQNHGADVPEAAYVKVRIEHDGGPLALGDVIAEVLFGGSWIPGDLLPASGGALEAFFPDTDGFPIPAGFDYTHQFRITYAKRGVYTAGASVVGASSGDVYASSTMFTEVVATPDVSLQLHGPLGGTELGVPTAFAATLRNTGNESAGNAVVDFTIGRSAGAMAGGDLVIKYFDGNGYQLLPLVTCASDPTRLCGRFGPGSGFPVPAGYDATTPLQVTFATADTYTVAASAVGVPGGDVLASDALVTHAVPVAADVSLQLHGPLSGTEVGVPAAFAATLRNVGGESVGNVVVDFTLGRSGGAMATGDLAIEYFDGTDYQPLPLDTCVNDATRLCGRFGPGAGFPVPAGYDATTPLRVTFATADTYMVAANAVGVPGGAVLASDTMFTQVVPHAIVTAQVLIDPSSLNAVYDGNPRAAVASTVPAGLPLAITYNALPAAPVDAGSYVVVAAVTDPAYTGSASALLTIAKANGSITFAPLSGAYGSAHAVTATLDQEASANCVVSGVPAQSAPVGSYTVSALCEGVNHVASATATYTVSAGTASISAVSAATVGVVTVDPQLDADARKSYFTWRTAGAAGEFVRASFVIGSGHAAPQTGDLELEYLESANGQWMPLSLAFDGGSGTWTGVFGPASGFPLVDGAESHFRATFHRGGRYTTSASLVGASSGLVLATSAPATTNVAELGLTGSGNTAGVVGAGVDTSFALVNRGTAALSSGVIPLVPAQPAPNNENVRGRFVISGPQPLVGASAPGCGNEACTSPDVAVEFFDSTTGQYERIFNLQGDGSGGLVGHFGAKTAGGVPVPAGHSGSFLFRTTFMTHTGTYTVASQVVGISSGTVYAEAPLQTIGIDEGAAASIAIVSGDAGAAVVGGNAYDHSDLMIEVRDIGGNPVPGATVAFNVLPGTGGAGATLSPPVPTDASGRTAITALSNGHAGVFEVSASLSNGVSLAQPFGLENRADTDPSQVQLVRISGNAQTAPVGGSYGLPLVARVSDRFGNGLDGVDVTFSAPPSGASVVPASLTVASAADGRVESGLLAANTVAGPVAITALIDGAACDVGSAGAECGVGFALANTAGSPASVTLVATPGSAEVGTLAAYAVTATVRDGNGNPVPGVSVTLVGPDGGAGVAPALAGGITDAAGQVAQVFDANALAGSFTLQAVVSGAAPASASLENLAGAATKIVAVSGSDQSKPVQTAFADLVVRVVDAFGNAVADGAAAEVTFTAPASGASALVDSPVSSAAGGLAASSAVANGMAGSYVVVASFNGHDVPFALENTVGAVAISDIVWSGNSATSIAYDGTPQAATATVTGTSLAPAFTYNGSSTPPTAVGSYLVIATVGDGNVSGTASAMLTITPAAAGASGITLAGGSFGYDGTNHAATVTNPNGVAYTLAYDTPNGLPPVDVGNWTATLTVTDPNHAAETLTATIQVTPAAVTLAFGNLAHVYDGSAKAATVTTTPAGVSGVSLAYAPDAAPVNAGNYTVTASLANPNYVLSGSTTAMLVIAKANGTVAFAGAANVTFDGQPHALTATIAQEPGNGTACVVTPAGEYPRVHAGATTLAAVCEGANHTASGSATLNVSARPVTIALSGLGSFPYDGQPHPAIATVSGEVAGFPAATVVSYNGDAAAPVAVGSYNVVASLDGSTADYAAAPASGLIVIGSANATVTLGNLAATYDGSPHVVSVTTMPAGLAHTVTYDGNTQAPTNAGSYSVVATITEAGYSGSASATLVIAKATATVTLGDLSQVWDGSPKPASVTTTPAGLTVNVLYDGVATVPSAVGSYAVLATVTDANHSGSANGTLRITADNATISLGNLAAVYDGSPHAASVTTMPAGLAHTVTYDGSTQAPTNAGSYSVVATITAPGYSGSASATLVIDKAAATITLGDLSQVWDGQPKPVSVTTTPAGLTVNVLYDGVLTVPSGVGSYTVLATITDTNHAGMASDTLVIGAGGASAIAANGGTHFTGTAGQPLSGALPSVKVTDAGGNPVAGVAVTFAAAAGHGTLSGASQLTNDSGIATLGGWILAAQPGDNVVMASAAGVTGNVEFTATGESGDAEVSATITSGRDYARFGQSVAWTMTVGNASTADQVGIPVAVTLPPELDASSAQWQCIAINGATCQASGSGDIADTVDLPAGSSVVYLLSATVGLGGGDDIALTITAEAAGGTASATDNVAIVLFRDGFEGGDGAQGLPVVPARALDSIRAVDLPAPAPLGLAPQVHAWGAGFRVESLQVDGSTWLRLVVATGAGESASRWSAMDQDGLRLAIADGHLILAGTEDTLSLPFAATAVQMYVSTE